MIIVLLIIAVAIGGPLVASYARSPSENILVESKHEAIEEIREVVSQLQTSVQLSAEASLKNALLSLLSALWMAAKKWIKDILGGGPKSGSGLTSQSGR